MKYIGTKNFDHEQQPRVGILVTNLGTPQAPEKGALRTYLKQFLSDPRVVDLPRYLWLRRRKRLGRRLQNPAPNPTSC